MHLVKRSMIVLIVMFTQYSYFAKQFHNLIHGRHYLFCNANDRFTLITSHDEAPNRLCFRFIQCCKNKGIIMVSHLYDTATTHHILSLLTVHIFELLHAFVAYEEVGKETEGKGTRYRLCALITNHFLVFLPLSNIGFSFYQIVKIWSTFFFFEILYTIP